MCCNSFKLRSPKKRQKKIQYGWVGWLGFGRDDLTPGRFGNPDLLKILTTYDSKQAMQQKLNTLLTFKKNRTEKKISNERNNV